LPLCFATGQGNTAPAVSTPASFDGAGDDMTEHARSCVAVVALAVVSACTPLGTNNLREQLDESTGVTVTSMSAPLEFFSPQPERGLQAASFAYLGPVEINRMGNLQSYLWLSVLLGEDERGHNPAGARPGLHLRITAAGTTLEPAYVSADARQIGLGQRVYERPANWVGEAFYAITAEQLTQLAAADTLMLEISAPNEAPRRYEPWKADPTGLRRFVERTAASAP